MKVLLVNGSPNKNGCTYTALSEVAGALNKNGIETEIFHLGSKAVSGCIGCYSCMETNKCFMDRVFFTNMWSKLLDHKPAAAFISARRSGTTATFDQINKYFTMSNMPVVSSQYWNLVHGNIPEEVKQDLEGMQTMRTLGNNIAWMLESIEAGKAAGVTLPDKEAPVLTNFIR